MAIYFLTIQDVIAMHDELIMRYGGCHGTRSHGLLSSALAQPMASFGGDFLYKDLAEMASVYFFHIIKNHPFVDGNKRTAVLASLVFIEHNNRVIKFNDNELFDLAIGVASGGISKLQLIEVFKQHSE